VIKLATILRASQFVAHEKHNLVSGPTFLADHAYLGELYGEYEEAYDAVVERLIGLGKPVNIPAITTSAAEVASRGGAGSALNWPQRMLAMEEAIRREVVAALPVASEGTKNFLQGLADESEARTYKIGQRAK
jgi:DNA-binding ferritin-like protein